MKINFLLSAFSLAAIVLFGCSESAGNPETQTEQVTEKEINNETQPPAQESEDVYYDIALSEARNYVKEKEGGTLTQQKINSYAAVVREQANQIMDEERKAQLQQLASQIQKDDLPGVKQLMKALEEN